jgi:hypothetical protein
MGAAFGRRSLFGGTIMATTSETSIEQNATPSASEAKPVNWREFVKVHPAAEMFPLMREFDPAGFKAMVEDVRANGMREVLKFWADPEQDLQLFDGRNRLDVLAEIGVLGVVEHVYDDGESDRDLVYLKEFDGEAWVDPKTRTGVLDRAARWMEVVEGDPNRLVLSFNVHRRHLTPELKNKLIEAALKARPETSDRLVGTLTHTDKNKVRKVRKKLEATGVIPPVEKRVGADKKSRSPARRKTKKNGADTTVNLPAAPPVVHGNPDPHASSHAMMDKFARLDAEVNPAHGGQPPPDSEILKEHYARVSGVEIYARLPLDRRDEVVASLLRRAPIETVIEILSEQLRALDGLTAKEREAFGADRLEKMPRRCARCTCRRSPPRPRRSRMTGSRFRYHSAARYRPRRRSRQVAQCRAGARSPSRNRSHASRQPSAPECDSGASGAIC